MTDLIPAWVEGILAPVEKLEVHRLGLRHPAVSVFVMDGTRTLLQRRALSKYHTPGLWANTCCTHAHWGEAPMDCAIRRLEEELGIAGLALRPAGKIEYRADVGSGLTEHEVVDVFVAQASQDLAVEMNPAEVMQTKWISRGDLADQVRDQPALFTPWLRVYLEAGIGETAMT